jgi:gluconokinase
VIVVIMGASGSGKTTVGQALAARLGWAFADGDDLHPAVNVAKMASGHALTDADREPWLAAVAAQIDAWSSAGVSGVMACSALRRRYRERLPPGARFVFLDVPRDVLAERMRQRHHFMPVNLLDSQLATLEPPEPAEPAVTVTVGATTTVDATVSAVLRALEICSA